MLPLLRLLLILLLTPVLALAENTAPTLCIATDLHYISPSLTDRGAYFTRMIENGDGKMVHYSDELTDAFCEQIIAQQPDCLILSGDLTFNGAKQSHLDLAEKLSRIDRSGVPVLVLPGNHDLYCYAAASFSGDSYALVDSITSEEFEDVYHELGFDLAISRDPYSLSYVAEPVSGVRVLMLDTNTRFMEGAVAQNTFAWLDAVLSDAKESGAKVISVSHQNLYAHSSLLYQGFMIANASMLESRYEKYGVAVNLSGHLHMQHTIAQEGKVPEIATSSLAVSPCQYGVITLGDDHASYRTQTVNVSSWAKKHGKTDPNLQDFSAYARDFFLNTSLRLKQSDNPEADALAKWIAEVNAAYFAGRTDLIHPAPASAMIPGDAFHSAYIASILAEPPHNHTQLDFPL